MVIDTTCHYLNFPILLAFLRILSVIHLLSLVHGLSYPDRRLSAIITLHIP